MKSTLSLFLILALAPMGWSQSASDSILGDAEVQQYLAAMRAEFSSGKVGAINEVLELNAEEAAAFWPLYQDYEGELFALGDRRLVLIEDFARATASDTLNDEFAAKAAADWFQMQADHMALIQSYYTQIAEALSPMKAAQFVQLEHRFNVVVDLMIAAQLPLIDPKLPQYLKVQGE